jgi:hypothetical protein
MVVIKFATYITRCPFSKKLIKPTNKICLFNKEQYDAFKIFINEILKQYLPLEIIDIILERTGYKKLIGRFGFDRYTHWTIKSNKVRGRFRKSILFSDNWRDYDCSDYDSSCDCSDCSDCSDK